MTFPWTQPMNRQLTSFHLCGGLQLPLIFENLYRFHQEVFQPPYLNRWSHRQPAGVSWKPPRPPLGFLGVYRPSFLGGLSSWPSEPFGVTNRWSSSNFWNSNASTLSLRSWFSLKTFSKFLLNSRFSLSTSMPLSCPCPWKPLDPTRPSSCILRSSCSRKRGRWTGGKNCPGGIRDKGAWGTCCGYSHGACAYSS